MAQAGSNNLHQLIEERGRVKAALTRLKTFYDTRGATESIDSLQARFDQHSLLLAKFDAIHWRIIALLRAPLRKRIMSNIGMILRTLITN